MQLQKRKSKRKIIIPILVLLLLAIVGAGLYGWYEFMRINAENNVGEVVLKESSSDGVVAATPDCTADEDMAATSGVFCAPDMAIKFPVPPIFKGKLIKAANYQVYQGPLNPNAKTNAGAALSVRQAVVGNNTLTIAQEPLRTGYVDVYHAQQNTYFDVSTKELSRVNSPSSRYDSTANRTTTTGAFSKGEPVPSFTVNSVRFFECMGGDSGMMQKTYLAVINDKIIKISLKHVGNTGNAANATEEKKIFDELLKSINALKAI